MKKILSSLVVFATLLLTGCYDMAELEPNSSLVGDDLLTINLSSSANSMLTRATQDPAEEEKINNAYVFVFNSEKSLVYSQYHIFSPVAQHQIVITEEDVKCGDDMTIAVVANIDNQIMDVDESALSGVTTLDELEDMSTLMLGVEHPLQRSSSFLMSGKKEGVNLTKDATVSVDVPLVRTDSKIKFNIKVDGSKYSNIEFTPTEWRVGSYPTRVKIFDTATEGEFAADCGEYTAWANFEQSATAITAGSGSATFAFYGLESILAAGTVPTSGSFAEQFKKREKQVKNGDGTNQEVFEYAPAGSAFVEFKGAIKYTDTAASTEYVADVVYKVKLGGINQAGNMEVNNFNTYRNTAYTYNVSIMGVNDIMTEVKNDGTNEVRPGAEGSIVTANNIMELDAYNSVFTYTFNSNMIDSHLTWDVSTIFSKGGKGDAVDYKWVHFRLNKINKSAYTADFMPYPGDNAAKDLALNSDAEVDKVIADVLDGKVILFDVDQLVTVLKRCEARRAIKPADNTLYDKNNNITYTVYVKENYYDSTPGSTAFEPMLWQQFVNTDKRVLNILSEYTESADTESSRSAAQISFRQATIQTMYNTEARGADFSGFGSQFYPRSVPSDPDAVNDFAFKRPYNKYNADMDEANSKDDGRANCIKFITAGKDKWSDFINVATWTLKSEYDYPLFKFLLYNRDMDGDGVIDANEIQWYMASINQLTDLWIGEDSFNPTSKLYLYSTWEKGKQHYLSSTVTGLYEPWSGDDYVKVDILWSSEGSSIGTASDINSGEDTYYRIVRNFGLQNNSTAVVDKIYTCQLPTTTADGWIELSRLNAKSIRNNITGALPNHELRDPAGNNKVPRKFAISKSIEGGNNYTWTSINAETSTLELEDNWRIPNQRELSLMYSVFPRNSTSWPQDNHFCRTGFCDAWEKDKSETRPGFSITKTGGRLTLLSLGWWSGKDDSYGGVRPVKDIN